MLFAGLWLNIPDYDAPTQMVKPRERNVRYVNAVLTIPKVCCWIFAAFSCLLTVEHFNWQLQLDASHLTCKLRP